MNCRPFKELTEPGFYWYRFNERTDWMMAYVERGNHGLFTRNFAGASQASFSNVGLYCGPISNPEAKV